MSSGYDDNVEFTFSDPGVRVARESDIGRIVELFRLNYKEAYPYPQFLDALWIKRAIYNDNILYLAIEEDGDIVASGAISLESGDYNDQLGEIGRLVVHPDYHNRKLGWRMIHALAQAADELVEVTVGNARTEFTRSQSLLEAFDFTPVGFFPQRLSISGKRESLACYVHLSETARQLRSERTPQVIPEAAPLASYVLEAMQLPSPVEIIHEMPPGPPEIIPHVFESMTRAIRSKLIRLDKAPSAEPLLFGTASIDQGMSVLRRHSTAYRVALDASAEPLGALGYRLDPVNNAVKGVQLVCTEEGLRRCLCELLLLVANETGAALIEVDVSAYNASFQRVFADLGFVPVAYLPGMAFHGKERLDVIRMLRLTIPYDPGQPVLTQNAQAAFQLVHESFKIES